MSIKIEELLLLYSDKVKEIFENEENFKKFLRDTKDIYNYSLINQISILSQIEYVPSCVLPYNSWSKIDENVIKGAKGIRLFEGINGKNNYVYDASQTTAKEVITFKVSSLVGSLYCFKSAS